MRPDQVATRSPVERGDVLLAVIMAAMSPSASDRVALAVGAVRTGVAALAVGVGLQLLLHVPLTATFRASLVVLAALEVLLFGRAVLSRAPRGRTALELALKLVVLSGGYIALSS